MFSSKAGYEEVGTSSSEGQGTGDTTIGLVVLPTTLMAGKILLRATLGDRSHDRPVLESW